MPDILIKSVVAVAESLLKQYHFDTGEQTCDQVLDHWLRNYDPRWVRLALIESLYQGRYKTISVEQIMTLWLRRGQPSYRFSHEFEALICTNLPQDLRLPPQQSRKSPSLPRPVITISAESLTPALTPIPASLPISTPPDLLHTSQFSENLPIESQPAERDMILATHQDLGSSSLGPTLPLVTDPGQAPTSEINHSTLKTFSPEPLTPETDSFIPKPATEITKFQLAPANTEVYNKLKEIARNRHQTHSDAVTFTPSEEQQTPSS